MKILDIYTCYDLFGLNCQKVKKLQVSLGCISHTLDLFGFGAWHAWTQVWLISHVILIIY